MAALGVGVIAFAIRAGGGGTRVLLTMAAGAIIAFLGMSMLSQLLIVPIAAALGAVLEVGLRVSRFLGRIRDRIPVLGPLVRRVGYGLTLGYVWAGDHHGADRDLDPARRHHGRHADRRRRRAGDRRHILLRAVEAAAARVAVGRLLADRRRARPREHLAQSRTAPPSRRRR